MARTAPSNASLPRDDEERRPSSSPTSPRAVGGDGRRIISSFQPLLVEVAGSMDDPTQQQLTARLRRYRNRYALIFRLMATIAAQRVSEDELFGDDSKPPLLFASPRAAITVDGGRLTILPRFHPRGSFQEEDTTNAINTFEHYMNYQFLSAALTHNMLRYRRQHSNMAGAEDGTPRPPLPRFTEEDSENFVVRHYVHESTRTASFMIADIRTRCAAVIDPRQCGAHAGRSEYEEDLQTLGLRLTHIVVTHYWADLAMGVEELCARHPSVVICAGGGVPAGAVAGTVALSPSLQLRCIAIPSFSPESVVVELRLCGELLALFCGPVWSTDAVPRADLSSTVSLHDDGMLQCEEDVVRRCQVNLKRFFYDRYLLPPSSPSSSPTTDSGTTTTPTATDVPESEEGFMANAVPWKECVVLFPSHGGYSNVTNQLDLYWAAHLGDLLRMRHSRTVIDTLLSPEAYAAYYAKMPRLPRPPLFLANRRWNGRSILRLTQGGSPEAAPTPSLASSSPSTEVVWVDVRDAPLYHRLHPAAAVLVPMSFPAEVYGAKRAELWLQCLLLPGQKVMALCGSPGQREVVRDRLRLLSPTSVVEVFTVEELLPLPAGEGTWSPEATYARHAASARAVGDRMCFASAGAAGHVWWIYAPHPLKRLATPESLVALDVGPSSATIVVDLRTPFEFKNGSHQQSVHVSLAELCEMMVAHTQALIASAQHHDEEGSGYPPLPVRPLAEQYMVKLHQQALMNEVPVVDARRDIRRLVLYCAGGYRSLIAESLLQRAVELTWMANSWTSHATMEATIEVVDVVGGAFQIMTQRPDLWQVKDRSIICIS